MSSMQRPARSVLIMVWAVATASVAAAQGPPPGPPGGPPGGFPGFPPTPEPPKGPDGTPLRQRFEPEMEFPSFPTPKPANPKAGAMLDLTGNWVSIVNEDYIYRMFTPWPGEYDGVPLTPAAKKVANAWTPAQDGSCKAYGIGGLMRMPTRLRISWEGVDVLKIETDAGVQTRRIVFTQAPPTGPRTLQGYSAGAWEPLVEQIPFNPLMAMASGATGPPKRSGTLKVNTSHHTGGWLRKNGVPYSEDASIREYFDRWPGPDGAEWMSVTTIVTDPVNLREPFYTSSHFRKEPDDSRWRPKPCKP